MPSDRTSVLLRRQAVERARECCEYCYSQRRFSSSPFSIEHVIPRARDGTSDLNNLALACQGCNNHKYNHATGFDPVSGEEVQLYHPRRDIWSEHFTWTADLTEMVGLTARGRATIMRLRLNRPEVVALRRILAANRLHPP